MSQPKQAQRIIDEYRRERDLRAYKSRRTSQLIGLPIFACLLMALTYYSYHWGYPFHAILIASGGIYILVKVRSLLLLDRKEYLEATKPQPPSLKKSLWSLIIFIAVWGVLSFFTNPS